MNVIRLHSENKVLERSLRQSLGLPGSAVQQAMGWDSSNVSRFVSRQQGVTIDKVDALVNALGLVVVTREYLDAIRTLCKVGAHCQCASEGAGECGPNNRARCGQSE